MKIITTKSPMIIVGVIGLTISISSVSARDYFDPALLSLGDGAAAITDLSAFETSGQIPAGIYLVTLFVNRQELGLYEIVFTKKENGQVLPELTPVFLDELGVNTSSLPVFADKQKDIPVDDITQLIPESQIHFDFSQLRLELSFPQVSMKPNIRGAVNEALWDDGIPALLLNYSINASRSRQYGQPDSSQTNLFSSFRSGLNWQAWRLRSDISYLRNENTVGKGEVQNYERFNFTNTYLSRDIRPWRSDILVGESTSSNDVFNSIPFRGVKLSSNEEMLPFSLRGFSPVVSGIAQSNAQVTISQNGNIVYQTWVAPGAFRIDDLYQTGMGGDLTVTVTEADGSVRTWTQAFSSLPMMLRPGGVKYEVTVGRYDGGGAVGSKESKFAQGTLIYGLPRDITLYGGGLFAKDYASFSAGSGISLGNIGAISADVTTSSVSLNNSSHQNGQSYRIRYGKSLLSTGTAIDLMAYRYSTSNYYSFADFNNTGYQLNEAQVPWVLDRQRSEFQMRLNQQLGGYGALYVSGTRRDYWNRNDTNTTLSAGYNGNWNGVSIGLAYSIDRIKSGDDWSQNRQFALNTQIPFSLFSSSPVVNHSYANYQLTHDSHGRVQHQTGVSGTALNDRFSYRIMQGWDNSNNSSGTSTLNLGWQGSKGMTNLGYSYSKDYNTLNLSSNGGLVVHSQGVTLSQQLGTAIAVVSAPDAINTKVMNGDLQTNSSGYAVVPYLSAYQNNTITLDPATLPDDVELTQSSMNVYPTKGAVVSASFKTRTGYQALITLTKNGEPVPFGSIVTVNSQNNSSIVGDAGQVYLSGLVEQGTLTVVWGKNSHQQCFANFNLANAVVLENNPVRMLNISCEDL